MAEPSLDITMVQGASAQTFLPDSHAGMTCTPVQGLSHAFPTSLPFSFIIVLSWQGVFPPRLTHTAEKPGDLAPGVSLQFCPETLR